MKSINRIKVLTQNNKELIKENDKLRKEIEIYIQEKEKMNILKNELETIKQMWAIELNEIRKQKKDYASLLKEFTNLKKNYFMNKANKR